MQLCLSKLDMDPEDSIVPVDRPSASVLSRSVQGNSMFDVCEREAAGEERTDVVNWVSGSR